jgi:dephospho-CoA kinase
MTKIIGLTGGIGSGKTTLAKYFNSKGIPIYIADDEAKKLMNSKIAVALLCEKFGPAVVVNGTIDKVKLSKIVFNNPDKLKELNAIIHPLVQKDFKKWLKKHQNEPFVLKETAILFETGLDKKCDYTITVVAKQETRIQRILERDKTTREAILDRMNNQWNDERKIEKSDFVINNQDFNEATKQADHILKLLKNI